MSLLATSADTSAAITAWATVATAAVALLAAAFAYFQLRDAGRDRRERNKPAVVVDFITRDDIHTIVFLTLHNTGVTTARDVRLEFDPPIWDGGDTSDEMLRRWVGQTFPTMPPGRELTSVFCQLPAHIAQGRPMRFTVTVHCNDYRGRPQTPEKYVLDLEVIGPRQTITRRTVHDVYEMLKQLNETIVSVTASGVFSGKGLQVFTKTTEELRRDEIEGMAEHEKRLEEHQRLAERLKNPGEGEE